MKSQSAPSPTTVGREAVNLGAKSKKIPEKTVEAKEIVQLKPVSRKPVPKEEHKPEQVQLKPVTKAKTKAEEVPEAQLKKVTEKGSNHEEAPAVQLKPIPKKKPVLEEKPEEVQLKHVSHSKPKPGKKDVVETGAEMLPVKELDIKVETHVKSAPESKPLKELVVVSIQQQPKQLEVEVVEVRKAPVEPGDENLASTQTIQLKKQTKKLSKDAQIASPAQPEAPEQKVEIQTKKKPETEKVNEELSRNEVQIDQKPSWRKPHQPKQASDALPAEEKPTAQQIPTVEADVEEDIRAPTEAVPTEKPEEEPIQSHEHVSLKKPPAKSQPKEEDASKPATPWGVQLKRTAPKEHPKEPEVTALEPQPMTESPEALGIHTESASVQLRAPASTKKLVAAPQQETVQPKPVEQSITIATKAVSLKKSQPDVAEARPEKAAQKTEKKTKASLTVAPRCQAPVFTKKLQPISSRPGKKIRMHCQFDGEPEPIVAWYRNETLIQGAERFAVSTERGGSTLEIGQVEQGDTGIYTCRAANEAGTASTSANVIVQGCTPSVIFT